MKIARSAILALVPACLIGGCGSGSRASGSHLSLQLNSSGPLDAAAPTIEMTAGETRSVVLVAVGADEAVQFTSDGLPAFAKLEGPILTLAPQRGDGGDYTVTLTATAGRDSSSVALHLHVLRFNTPPRWSQSTDFHGPSPALRAGIGIFRVPCPSPTRCTAAPDSFVEVPNVCDADGDGMEIDVEVVPRGQPFLKQPNFTASAPSRYPPPPPGNCSDLRVYLLGLVAEQSYDFAVRIRDQFGAVAEVPGATDGWYTSAQLGFDQGPCTARQCAGLGPSELPGCLVDLDCRSGTCDLAAPTGFGTFFCK